MSTERIQYAIGKWLGKKRASQCTTVDITETISKGTTVHTWGPIQDEIKATDLQSHLNDEFASNRFDVSTRAMSEVAGACELVVTASPKQQSSIWKQLPSSWPVWFAVCMMLLSMGYVLFVLSQRRQQRQ
jgi:hypothetical protein